MSRSARRALQVMRHVVESDTPIGLMEISAAVGMDKTTSARQLALLEEMGLLDRDPGSKKYQLGPDLVALAIRTLRRTAWREAAKAHLSSLRDLTGETVSLHIRSGRQRICIDGVESRQAVRRGVPFGEVTPIVNGTAGRAMLVQLPASEVDLMIAEWKLDGALASKLRHDLDDLRRDGFFVARSENWADVMAVSAPIRFTQPQVAAITVSGPLARWTERKARAAGPQIVSTANRIAEVALGV